MVTGFAMYGQSNPGGFFYTLFGWVGPLLGGIQVVRFVHHVLTWVFLIFIPIHVYLAHARRHPRADRDDLLDHQRRPVRAAPTSSMSIS